MQSVGDILNRCLRRGDLGSDLDSPGKQSSYLCLVLKLSMCLGLCLPIVAHLILIGDRILHLQLLLANTMTFCLFSRPKPSQNSNIHFPRQGKGIERIPWRCHFLSLTVAIRLIMQSHFSRDPLLTGPVCHAARKWSDDWSSPAASGKYCYYGYEFIEICWLSLF